MKKINGTDVYPRTDPATRLDDLTKKVMRALKTATVEEALTVCVNIAGHLCAQVSEGKPSAIQANGNSIAEAIKKAAITKIVHDDNVRRKQEADGEA